MGLSWAHCVSLSIVLAFDYGSMGKGVAAWNHDGCLNILVPSLGGDFLLKRRKGLVCLLVIQVRLCVWGVNESNFLKLSPGKVCAPPFLSCP